MKHHAQLVHNTRTARTQLQRQRNSDSAAWHAGHDAITHAALAGPTAQQGDLPPGAHIAEGHLPPGAHALGEY